jgi:hypothetical protein
MWSFISKWMNWRIIFTYCYALLLTKENYGIFLILKKKGLESKVKNPFQRVRGFDGGLKEGSAQREERGPRAPATERDLLQARAERRQTLETTTREKRHEERLQGGPDGTASNATKKQSARDGDSGALESDDSRPKGWDPGSLRTWETKW